MLISYVWFLSNELFDVSHNLIFAKDLWYELIRRYLFDDKETVSTSALKP